MRRRVGVTVGRGAVAVQPAAGAAAVTAGPAGSPSGPAAAAAAPVALALSAASARRAARRAGAVALVDHKVDRHLALQAADVPMAEVIAEFVYLEWEEEAHFSLGNNLVRAQLVVVRRSFSPSVRPFFSFFVLASSSQPCSHSSFAKCRWSLA